MEDSRPLLSIGIPTYNHCRDLRKCLDCILSQTDWEKFSDRVEIVISDNDSNDGTALLIEEYKNKFSRFHYNRNQTNLGYDRNVEKVIYASSGDFIWTLSDNEFIKPEAMGFLLGVLEENREIVWLCIDNGCVLGDEQNKKMFRNGDDWLREMRLTGGQISQNIYNRRFLPKDISRYFDNQWIHFSLAREIAASRPQMIVKNIFKEDVDNICHWAAGGRALFTFSSLKNIAVGLVGIGYNKNIIKRIERSMDNGLPRVVASAKINGLKISGANLKFIISNFYKSPFPLFWAIIFFFLPVKIIKFLKYIIYGRGVR